MTEQTRIDVCPNVCLTQDETRTQDPRIQLTTQVYLKSLLYMLDLHSRMTPC